MREFMRVNETFPIHGGQTMLMLAIQYAPELVGDILATEGLNVNIQNTDGWTALHFAIHHHPPIAWQILQRTDVNLRVRTSYGMTYLIMACMEDQVDIGLCMLRHAGTDVNAAADDGTTALMKACFYSPELALAMIADSRVEVNRQSKHLYTALRYAFRAADPRVALALLTHPQVDVWARDAEGKAAHEVRLSASMMAMVKRVMLRDIFWVLMSPGCVLRRLPPYLTYMALLLL